ncbi:MAG TPA: permease-like cell division protein FtsX [Acidimicrobiales bacterium]|nr:permease-like cell division protein FtsX [Acidimicrobiales bacterium]
MSTPEDFEERLAARLEQAGEPVTGGGVTREGVAARHRERARARRLRQGAVVAVAASVLVVLGVALSAGDHDTTPIAAEGRPTTSGAGPTPGPSTCQEDVDVILFLDPAITEAEREALAASLEDEPNVVAFRYVSQEEAYQEARELFADQPATRDLLQEEDVPPSFRIARTEGEIPSFAGDYEDRPGVREVESLAPTTSAPPRPPSPSAAVPGSPVEPDAGAVESDIAIFPAGPLAVPCDGSTGPAVTVPPSTGTTMLPSSVPTTPPGPSPEVEGSTPPAGPGPTTTVAAPPTTTIP